MKLRMRFAIAAVLLASVTAPAVSAEKKKQQKGDEGARGMFMKKTSDAMTILVLKYEGGNLIPVAPSTEFKAGDQIKIQLKSNFDGFVYVVNIQPSGKRRLMFPHPEAMDNAVHEDGTYEIPQGHIMEFDAEKGTEVLQVIMTRSRIAYLDDALKAPDGDLSQSASSAAAELQPGIAHKVKSVVPPSDDNKVRSRDISFAAGKDKDPKGSVVAITDNGAAGGKLQQGETAEFQIRLKHN